MSCCDKCGKCNGLPRPELPWGELGPPYPAHLVIMGADTNQVQRLLTEIPRITVLAASVSALLPLAAQLGNTENLDLLAAVEDPLPSNCADWVCIQDINSWGPHWLKRSSKWLRPGGRVLLAGLFYQGITDQSQVTPIDWETWRQSMILAGLNSSLVDKTIVQELYAADGTLEYSLFQAIVIATKEE